MTVGAVRSLTTSGDDALAVLHSMLLSNYLPAGTDGRPFASFAAAASPEVLARLSSEQRTAFARDALRLFGRVASDAACGALASLPELFLWRDALRADWKDGRPETLAFSTSGSTGIPKTYAYPFTVLEEEAEALVPYFSDRRRIVTVMPTHHIFGFVTSSLLPQRLGIPVLRLPPLPVGELFTSLLPGDLFIAFPLFWQAVRDRVENRRAARPALPKGVAGLSSSAPCPPEIIEALTRPGEKGAAAICSFIAEIYGSTETSAVGVRKDCRAPYALLPLWERVVLEGGEFGIQRVRRDGKRDVAAPMPDIVEWQGETAFAPVRRRDSAVQVGGVNVRPCGVADVIRSHPAVKDCVVRLMRPEEGARLKAFIVPEDAWRSEGRKVFGAEFRGWLRERLTTPAMPKSITLGDSLPVTPAGKSRDWTCPDDGRGG